VKVGGFPEVSLEYCFEEKRVEVAVRVSLRFPLKFCLDWSEGLVGEPT